MKTTFAAFALGLSFLTAEASAKLSQHIVEREAEEKNIIDEVEANEFGSIHRELADTLEPSDIPKQRYLRAIMVSGDNSGGKYDSTIKSGEVKTAFGRKCKLELTEEGNLAVYRRKKSGEFVQTWQSGDHGGGKGEYQTSLSRRGNLVTTDLATGNVVWSTRSKDLDGKDWACGPAQYVLYFGNEGSSLKYGKCTLRIETYRKGCPVPGEPGTFKSEIFSFLWANHHSISSENPYYYTWESPMTYVLQKGEATDNADLNMMLDDQCNLIVFRGRSVSSVRKIVWSSADDGAEPVDPANDCHFFARRKDPNDPNDKGEMVLYKGPYKRSITNGYQVRGPSYWSRPADCVRPKDGQYDVMVKETGPESFDFSCGNM